MNPASQRIAKQNAEHEARQVEADRGERQPDALTQDTVKQPATKRPEKG
jgi:hypothetical protein